MIGSFISHDFGKLDADAEADPNEDPEFVFPLASSGAIGLNDIVLKVHHANQLH